MYQFSIFGLTRPRIEPGTSQARSERSNTRLPVIVTRQGKYENLNVFDVLLILINKKNKNNNIILMLTIQGYRHSTCKDIRLQLEGKVRPVKCVRRTSTTSGKERN